MHEISNGSATLPRGFRFRYQEGFSTPEPTFTNEEQKISPPRHRLKIRRRIVSSRNAPTDNFLASVRNAEPPLPMNEIPQKSDDPEMMDQRAETDPRKLAPGIIKSPPKTPVISLSIDAVKSKPDWNMDSIQTGLIHRPLSALSSDSDISSDSLDSLRPSGRLSEDESCTSPESDGSDPFQFPVTNVKVKKIDSDEWKSKTSTPSRLNTTLRIKGRKDAPWSKAQTAHLWATYLIYLQDPTLTPIRIGASHVPPEGVCHRVAREAKRSWRGPKLTQPSAQSTKVSSQESGEITMTSENTSRTYAQWPHSSCATRSKLRNICRHQNCSSLYRRHNFLQSRNSTPFSKRDSFHVHERFASDSFSDGISTHDMSISLSQSISTSMQPNGPLANLSRNALIKNELLPTNNSLKDHNESQGKMSCRAPTLGSPFSCSYGPGSSETGRRPGLYQSSNLGSPLHFDQTRSLSGTQKRRAQHALQEDLDSAPAVMEPKILSRRFENSLIQSRRVRTRGFSLGDETIATHALHSALDSTPSQFGTSQINEIETFQTTSRDPPRLGSPFSESGMNNTFPRRLFSDATSIVRNPSFVTPHHKRQSIESLFERERRSLLSQLDFLNGRLKQIREKDDECRI